MVVKSFLLSARPFIAVKTPVFFTERKYCCCSVVGSSSIYHSYLYACFFLQYFILHTAAQASHILTHSAAPSHTLYSSHVFTSSLNLNAQAFFSFDFFLLQHSFSCDVQSALLRDFSFACSVPVKHTIVFVKCHPATILYSGTILRERERNDPSVFYART